MATVVGVPLGIPTGVPVEDGQIVDELRDWVASLTAVELEYVQERVAQSPEMTWMEIAALREDIELHRQQSEVLSGHPWLQIAVAGVLAFVTWRQRSKHSKVFVMASFGVAASSIRSALCGEQDMTVGDVLDLAAARGGLAVARGGLAVAARGLAVAASVIDERQP